MSLEYLIVALQALQHRRQLILSSVHRLVPLLVVSPLIVLVWHVFVQRPKHACSARTRRTQRLHGILWKLVFVQRQQLQRRRRFHNTRSRQGRRTS